MNELSSNNSGQDANITESTSSNFTLNTEASKSTENKKFPNAERYNQTFRYVMTNLGVVPFRWIKAKLEEYRSSKEANSILQEVIPVRLKDIGMKGIVQLPSPMGRYIVHVGQVHSTSDSVTDYLSPDIAVSQKAIERLLIQGKITEVFQEGQFEDGNKIDDILNQIRSLELNREFVSRLPAIIESVSKNIGVRSFSIYKYVYRRKIEDYLQKCIEQGWGNEQRKAQDALKILSMEDKFVDPYKELGGIGISQAKGTVKVYGSEDRDAHSKGSKLTNRIRQLRAEILEEYQKDPDSKRTQELIEDLKSAYKDFEEFDHLEREKVAIQKIVNHPSLVGKRIVYLVYGADHDFSAAVSEQNSQHPDNQFGLIYITDIDSFKLRYLRIKK